VTLTELEQITELSAASCLRVFRLPWILGRRAGIPLPAEDALLVSRTAACVDRILSLEERCAVVGEHLCNELELFIGGATGLVRSMLVQLRRDIHNDRLPKAHRKDPSLREFRDLCPARLHEMFDEWLHAKCERVRLREQAETLLPEEVAGTRVKFRRLLLHSEFRKALALSSQDLIRELREYVQNGKAADTRKIIRPERGLVKYYSRSAFKLSPFSSFTRVFVMLETDNARKSSFESPCRHSFRRYVEINRSLIACLAALLSDHPDTACSVPFVNNSKKLDLNTSLMILRHQSRNDWALRMQVPIESMVCLAGTEALRRFAQIIEANGGLSGRQELLSRLSPEPALAEQTLQQLLHLGLLRPQALLPEDDSTGETALADFLKDLTPPIAASVRRLLELVAGTEVAFAGATDESRIRLLSGLEHDVNAVLRAFTGPETKPWRGTLLYENCVEDRVGAGAILPGWENPMLDLQGFLVRYAPFLDTNIGHRSSIRAALEDYEGRPVELLKFVHEFDPFKYRSPEIAQFEQLRLEFGSLLAGTCGDEALDIRDLDLKFGWSERVAGLGIWPEEESLLSVFCSCQPALVAGSERIVVDALRDGFGKSIIRYSNNLSPSNREAVVIGLREAFQDTWQTAEPCEIRAAFDFNCNLHPEITERVIAYSSDTRNPNEILLSDLTLELGPNREIILRDRVSGRRIVPLDLGSMASAYAPSVYSLLKAISSSTIMAKPFHPYSWPRRSEASEEIRRFPRLTFGPGCILRRKGWSVSPARLPLRSPQSTDLDYFTEVRRWQKSLGLPDEVFVHEPLIWPPAKRGGVERKRWNKHKPQYVHFASQMFIAVFEKCAAEAEGSLYFEEMLPERSTWIELGLRRPTEFGIEWWIGKAAE
jgi:hypothetical protein